MKRTLIIVALLLFGCRRTPELPAYINVPQFDLTDSSGRHFSLNELGGKVWIADFIFTSCAGVCPAMTQKMKSLQDVLPPELHMVSFTVDPDRDTPAALADYAKVYRADTSRWHFLTGEKQALYKLSIEGFKLGVDDAQGTEAEPIMHSTRFVLVDRQGRIRGYYSGIEDSELERLAEDARSLL